MPDLQTDTQNMVEEKEEAKEESEKLARDIISEAYNKVEEEPEPKEPVDEKVEIKVNGVTRSVLKRDVDAKGGVEAYQKVVAADMGLRNLADERKRFEQEKLEFNTAKALSEKKDKPEVTVNELAKKYRESLFDGDEAGADELLTTIAQSRTLDSRAIQNDDGVRRVVTEQVQQELGRQRYEQDLVRGKDMFSEKFPSLADDPRLFAMVDEETLVVEKEHSDWSPTQIIEEAAVRVKSWRDGITGAPKEHPKRRMGMPKSGTGRTRPKATPTPTTPSDYVRMLQEQRSGIRQ